MPPPPPPRAPSVRAPTCLLIPDDDLLSSLIDRHRPLDEVLPTTSHKPQAITKRSHPPSWCPRGKSEWLCPASLSLWTHRLKIMSMSTWQQLHPDPATASSSSTTTTRNIINTIPYPIYPMIITAPMRSREEKWLKLLRRCGRLHPSEPL